MTENTLPPLIRDTDDDWDGERVDAYGRCTHCGAQMELDPIYGRVYYTCGDCFGGKE